jgi:hypothetical protein
MMRGNPNGRFLRDELRLRLALHSSRIHGWDSKFAPSGKVAGAVGTSGMKTHRRTQAHRPS